MQDDACGTYSEEGAVGDNATLAVGKDSIVNKGTGVGRTIAEDMSEVALLVTTDIEDAMVEIHRWVAALDRALYLVTLSVFADDVIAHLQWEDLLEMKDILNDVQRTAL